jgi:hypothetical protein
MQLSTVSTVVPVKSFHAGRRLRGRQGAIARRLPLTQTINSQIQGDELVSAVAFLSHALGLPALNPDSDRTAEINLVALRRAAA